MNLSNIFTKLILLFLLSSVLLAETVEEYQTNLTNDIIKFQSTYWTKLSSNDVDKFLKTNQLIVAKIVMAEDIYTLDGYTLLYLDYKEQLKKQLNIR